MGGGLANGVTLPDGLPLIEQYNGTEWAVASSPYPSGSYFADLYSVACAAAGDCWAVGAYAANGDGGSSPLTEEYAGDAWAVVSDPDSTALALNGVSCASASDCWAVGTAGEVRTPADPAERRQRVDHYRDHHSVGGLRRGLSEFSDSVRLTVP